MSEQSMMWTTFRLFIFVMLAVGLGMNRKTRSS